MKHSDQNRLLKEILTGGESSGFRQASLERGLTAIRRRRQAKRAASLCVLTALLALIGWQVTGVVRHHSRSSPRQASLGSSPVTASRSRPVEVKFITDEELLAHFPDRPVALIGKPGHQQLVFLDRPGKRARDKM